jgi:uncharacterized protein (DUF1778 family)
MPSLSQTARLEARITPELHAMLKRAAELQGRSVSDFVVATMHEAARSAIEQSEVIRLSLEDQHFFAQALLSPPEPGNALKRAKQRHQQLIAPE